MKNKNNKHWKPKIKTLIFKNPKVSQIFLTGDSNKHENARGGLWYIDDFEY